MQISLKKKNPYLQNKEPKFLAKVFYFAADKDVHVTKVDD